MKVPSPMLPFVIAAAICTLRVRAGTCGTTCSDSDCPSTGTLSARQNVTVSAPMDCEAQVGLGSHAYISSAIINALDDSYLIITYNGASDGPTTGINDVCYYRQTSPAGRNAFDLNDISVTIKCNNIWNGCPFRYYIETSCFVPCCYKYDRLTDQYSIACVDGSSRSVTTATVTDNGVESIKVTYFDQDTSRNIKVSQCLEDSTTDPPTDPAPSPSPTTVASYNYSLKRTVVTGSGCQDKTACYYRCSRGYRLTIDEGNAKFAPSEYVDGCQCATIYAKVQSDATILSSDDKITAYFDDNENVFVNIKDADCTMKYVKGDPSDPFKKQSYTRNTVSPSTCNVPASCDYLCSVGYDVQVVGTDKLVATPVGTQLNAACSCLTLTAIVMDDGTAVDNLDGDDLQYQLAMSSDKISVKTTISGTTCTGTYVEGKSASTGALAMGLALVVTVAMSMVNVYAVAL